MKPYSSGSKHFSVSNSKAINLKTTNEKHNVWVKSATTCFKREWTVSVGRSFYVSYLHRLQTYFLTHLISITSKLLLSTAIIFQVSFPHSDVSTTNPWHTFLFTCIPRDRHLKTFHSSTHSSYFILSFTSPSIVPWTVICDAKYFKTLPWATFQSRQHSFSYHLPSSYAIYTSLYSYNFLFLHILPNFLTSCLDRYIIEHCSDVIVIRQHFHE